MKLATKIKSEKRNVQTSTKGPNYGNYTAETERQAFISKATAQHQSPRQCKIPKKQTMQLFRVTCG